jgi:hypothetical protein
MNLSTLFILLDACENPDRGRPARLRDGSNATATWQLSRIRELPAIRILAGQLGLCRPGEFSAATVQAIVDLICVHGRVDAKLIDRTRAFQLGLSEVVKFLEGFQAACRTSAASAQSGTLPAAAAHESAAPLSTGRGKDSHESEDARARSGHSPHPAMGITSQGQTGAATFPNSRVFTSSCN